MSFSGAKTTSSTQSSQQTSPWAPAQPLMQNILGGAQSWLDSSASRTPYAGQNYASESDPTKAGAATLANGGGANTQAAQGYYGDVLSGKYASASNPYFQQMADSVTSSVMPSINATFSKAGMTGSDPHQYTLANGLANAIAPYAYSNYQQGLSGMQNAAQAAPTLDTNVAGNQITAGQLGESYTQKGIDQNVGNYYYNQNLPFQSLQQALSLGQPIAAMGSQSSGNSTTTQQQQQSPLQTALGLGLGAAAMFGTGGLFPGVGSALGSGLSGMLGGGASSLLSPGTMANGGWSTSLLR